MSWDTKKNEKKQPQTQPQQQTTQPVIDPEVHIAVEAAAATADIKVEDGDGAPIAVPSMKDMIREIIEGMMPAMVAAMRIGQASAQPAPQQAPLAQMQAYQLAKMNSERVLGGERCHSCGQYKSACKEEHAFMVVYPTRIPELAGGFPGVTVNSVTYISADNQHQVCVPSVCVDTFAVFIQKWEDSERQARLGIDKTSFKRSERNRRTAELLGLA